MTPAQILLQIQNELAAAGGLLSNVGMNSPLWALIGLYTFLIQQPLPLPPPPAPVLGPNPKRNELEVILFQINSILALNGGLESNIPVGVIDAYWRLINRYRAVLNAPPSPGQLNG
jgi:hypothetical protein